MFVAEESVLGRRHVGPRRAVCPRVCKPQTILKRQVCSFGKKGARRNRRAYEDETDTRPPPVTTRRPGGQAARRASRSAVWTDADASRGRGAGTPKANGAPRGEEGRGRLPPATVLQKQKPAVTVVTVVTVTVLTAFQAFQSPSRKESGGDSPPAHPRGAEGRESFFITFSEK